VLGASGNVLFTSQAAEQMASRAAWIRIGRCGVRLTNHALDQQLQRNLQECRQVIGRQAATAMDDLETSAPDGTLYRISLAPLMFQGRLFGIDQPSVVITIARVEAAEAALRARLRNLTSAELALALAVARGSTLAGYARGRGISLHTVRAQLKVVFQKTGTHRQAELVSLILHRHADGSLK
jgi:DNA-binding CsgD family transcriptional regulator